MKKTIAVILSVIMLAACFLLPVSAGVDNATELLSGNLVKSNYVLSSGEYRISSGNTITVPNGKTLYISSGATLYVVGTLEVSETASVISTGGKLILKYSGEGAYGKVTGYPENVCGGNATNYVAEIVISRPVFAYYSGITFANPQCVSAASPYADVGLDAPFVTKAYATEIEAPLNQFFSFKTSFTDKSGVQNKYNSELLRFKLNGVDMQNTMGVNQSKEKITSAGYITFNGVNSNPDDYLRKFNIYIPSGSGYEVFGKTGETTSDVSTVKLKYGQEFIFDVLIDASYNKSHYEVYCVNRYKWSDDNTQANIIESSEKNEKIIGTAEFLEKWRSDELTAIRCHDARKGDDIDGVPFYCNMDGSYHLDSSLISNEMTIVVTGVASNETINFAASLFEMIKNFFVQIRQLFEAIFGGSLI